MSPLARSLWRKRNVAVELVAWVSIFALLLFSAAVVINTWGPRR